jgi:DNA-binding beta-propeller fold protein YncE
LTDVLRGPDEDGFLDSIPGRLVRAIWIQPEQVMRAISQTVLMPILLLTSGLRAAETPALREAGRIELANAEGRIDHMAFDPQTGRLFVAALGNNTVEVVDTRAGQVVGRISGLSQPQGIGIAKDSGRLFVANAEDGTCRVFDVASLRPLVSVDLKSDADNVRYDAAAKRIYVGYGDGALAILDGGSGKRPGDIKLSAHPESFQLESQGRRIFINLPEADGVIAVADRNSAKVVDTWPLKEAKANFPMALDEAHHRLFVGCRKPAKLLVLDISSGKTVAAVDCVGDTDDVWYDAANSQIYVSGGEGAVTVIQQTDADHYKVAATIPTAPGARTSFFSPDRGELFVAVPHRGGQRAQLRIFKTR